MPLVQQYRPRYSTPDKRWIQEVPESLSPRYWQRSGWIQMSESNELIDYVLIDEIRRLLDRFQWISSYELFYQKIEKIETQLIQKHREIDEVNLKKKTNSGISLRIISKTKRLVETSLGISSLHKITNLTEPRSTQKIEEILIFPQLKNPRIKSIAGDQSKSINFHYCVITFFIVFITFFFH